jgi:hypothetical protein
LVAVSVGSDILDANGGSDIIAIKDNLDAIWLIAELVVMSGGAGNGGRVLFGTRRTERPWRVRRLLYFMASFQVFLALVLAE